MSIDNVTDITPRVQYTAAAAQTAFDYPFPIFTDADLVVDVDGETQALDTDYTVSGEGEDTGGTVTFLSALAGSEIVTIYRDIALERLTDIQQNGRWSSSTYNDEQDKTYLILQQLKSDLRRTLRMGPTDTGADDDLLLPDAVDRAGSYLAFDAEGEPSMSSGTGNDTALRTDLASATSGSDGSRLVGFRQPGTGSVARTVAGILQDLGIGVSIRDFGAVGGGVTDDTTAIKNCYAYCKLHRKPMWIPSDSVGYRITSNLLWDSPYVPVRGSTMNTSVLLKDTSGGDFVGVTISGMNPGCVFSDFSVNVLGASGGVPPTPASGHAIVVSGECRNLTLQRIRAQYHTGHAFYLNGDTVDTGFFSRFADLEALYCGVDGMRLNRHFATRIENLNLFGNAGWGFNVLNGSNYNTGVAIICQNNVTGGAQIASQQNDFSIYGEANVGPDIVLTAASVQNKIINTHSDTAPADCTDLGTRNIIEIISVDRVASVNTEYVTRPERTTNVAGEPVHVIGGKAGSGASPQTGGNAVLQGGDAAGTGNSNGGRAFVNGGTGVGTGVQGDVILQENNGAVVVGASVSPTNASAGVDLKSTTKVLILNRVTTVQRDAMTAAAGMLVYNTTTGKLNVRGAAAWEEVTSA